MKTRKKSILLFSIGGLLVLSFIWGLWPHSFAELLSVNTTSVTSLACHASISGVSDGNSYIESYALSSLTPDEEIFQEIMAILKRSSYRRDFRNLLPCPVTAVSASRQHQGYLASLLLVWGIGPEESASVTVHGGNVVSVRLGSNDGFQVYHLYDKIVLHQLVDHMKSNGASA